MIDLFINGIVMGSILALGAVSLTFQYGVLNFPNLAHGEFIAIGAYLTLLGNVWFGWGLIQSGIFAIIVSIGLGILLEKLLWKPLRYGGAGLVSFLIISMGASIFLRSSIIAIFGGSFHYFDIPAATPVTFLGVSIGKYQLLVLIFSIISMLAIYYILQRTRLGKSLRAISDSTRLAKISGIDVDWTIRMMWVIVMILVGIAGVMYGLVVMVRPNMGFYLLLPIFAAVILGGVGNVYGAIIGAMILGISQEVSTKWLPTQYKVAVAFVALIIVLIFRPKGLFKGMR
ncbi:branched-chain amino acid ABC transporter permease [candidate division MSBL1 archaeon SCGC-AAA259D14]|uniref:Branched-chain amino acid ABC transporter permease n=1 Tax=candidate division MSBL1 archaeon SCGC-AAA259D14 TaxID=1698261 RepID=A0A133U8V5_9EURY|nr:branched-chain amino acid ABC transporter permease [candidate division MSBL1 archaeon SCGC-AAA259D14]